MTKSDKALLEAFKDSDITEEEYLLIQQKRNYMEILKSPLFYLSFLIFSQADSFVLSLLRELEYRNYPYSSRYSSYKAVIFLMLGIYKLSKI